MILMIWDSRLRMIRFRWVACQFEFLEGLANESAYRSALESLPPSLPATYERMLEKVLRLPESTQRIVQEALKWILFAYAPLSINHLCEAVSVEIGSKKSNAKSTVKSTAIERHCGSFVRRSADGEYIESAHFTVKEFFSNLSPKASPRFARFCMGQDPVNIDLASTCLTYLNYEDFTCPVPDDMGDLLRYPFYSHAAGLFDRYAEGHWQNDTIRQLGGRLFNKARSSNFLRWCHNYVYVRSKLPDVDESLYDDFRKALSRENKNTIYWAALIGVPELLEEILSSGGEINNRSPCGTPLHAAVLGHHCFMLSQRFGRIYLTQEKWYREFRGWMLDWDHRRKSCVELLLSHGADPDIPFSSTQSGDITTQELLLYSGDVEIMQKLPELKKPLDSGWLKRLRYVLTYGFGSEDGLRVLELIDKSKVTIAPDIGYLQFAAEFRAAVELNSALRAEDDAHLLLRAAASQGSIDVIRNILNLRGVDINSSDENGDTALHLAVVADSCSCLEFLIQQGAVSKKNSNGLSPLHLAAWKSSVACFDVLLKFGCDPDERTANSLSLSHLAACGNNEGMLEMLLQKFGENFLHKDDRDASGLTPVLVAAGAGSSAALRFLLPFSDPHDMDSNDEPLLHLAAEQLDLDGIQAIVERGADPVFKCARGFNILHHLASNSQANRHYCQMALDYGVSKNDISLEGASPLHMLLTEQDLLNDDQVELAIQLTSEINVNISDKMGRTPLHLLLCTETTIELKLRILTNFFEAGANITLESADQDSFFHELIRKLIKSMMTFQNTSQGIEDWLIRTKDTRQLLSVTIAAINEVQYLEQPIDGWRPLQACLLDENLSLQLLSKGVDPNLRDKLPQRFSALERECSLNREKVNKDLVRRLCEAHKQAMSNNTAGNSLLHILCQRSSSDIALLSHIRDLIPDVNTRDVDGDLGLIIAIKNDQVMCVEQLLKYGARLDLRGGRNQCSWYPLHWAAVLGNHEILRLLLSHEMDWNLRTLDFFSDKQSFAGCTALHLALLNKQFAAVNFLLDRALIKINAQDDWNRTPLHFAAQFTDAYMIANLIERGADANAMDKDGNSVLHYSVRNAANHEDILVAFGDSRITQRPNKYGDTPKMIALCEGKTKAVEILDSFLVDKGMICILYWC